MTTRHITVGIDGSKEASNALRWAVAEAQLRGVGVEAIHVWRYPVWTYSPAIIVAPVFAREDLEAGARAVLDNTVDEVLTDEDDPPAVERVIQEGAAAEQLVRRAQTAELLVVGHRGRGGFAGLLLGSGRPPMLGPRRLPGCRRALTARSCLWQRHGHGLRDGSALRREGAAQELSRA